MKFKHSIFKYIWVKSQWHEINQAHTLFCLTINIKRALCNVQKSAAKRTYKRKIEHIGGQTLHFGPKQPIIRWIKNSRSA
jgi:hypothetical protein